MPRARSLPMDYEMSICRQLFGGPLDRPWRFYMTHRGAYVGSGLARSERGAGRKGRRLARRHARSLR